MPKGLTQPPYREVGSCTGDIIDVTDIKYHRRGTDIHYIEFLGANIFPTPQPDKYMSL